MHATQLDHGLSPFIARLRRQRMRRQLDEGQTTASIALFKAGLLSSVRFDTPARVREFLRSDPERPWEGARMRREEWDALPF